MRTALCLIFFLSACTIGDPAEPGRFSYGTGGFALVSTAERVKLDDGTEGWTIACRANLEACRVRARDLCPNGYSRISKNIDDPGPSLAESVRTTSLRQSTLIIQCAGV